MPAPYGSSPQAWGTRNAWRNRGHQRRFIPRSKRGEHAVEETARSVKKGMWVLGAKYESPRAYRKRVGIS